MYKVQYIDNGKPISLAFYSKDRAEEYARNTHTILNVHVSVIRVSEELVLSLLPRDLNTY